MTGYDGLLVTGRAHQPVYLWIQDGHAEICKADHLWGLDPYQTQAILGSELNQKNLRVASIGIGGEAQIPMSSILCDHGRMAGRTGMGAVMGSKQLKAVAVKGTGKVPVFDTVRSAVDVTGANTSVIFVPARFAPDPLRVADVFPL